MTDFTIGFVQLLGNANVVTTPPAAVMVRNFLRSGPFDLGSIALPPSVVGVCRTQPTL